MNLRKCAARCLIAAIAFGLSAAALAQQSPKPRPNRPTIGLVLSGGGARGGVHIGVLRALEELHIPVDYIAGTSVGAVVGSFYASGMTVDEMETFTKDVDWSTAFTNPTPRPVESFRRKRDDDLFLVQQKPGFNNGEITLPLGAIQGQTIQMILTRVMLPVADVHNFDNLMIPFRAVAGDIVTGDAVVLGSGDLATSVHASLSVPTIMTPVEIDGRLLVDGGIANNLPVDVARSMGADHIIAIEAASPLYDREDMRSALDVTVQLSGLLTSKGTEAQEAMLKPDDVLLVPELSDNYTSSSFGRMAETIDKGYELVMQNRESLEKFALDDEAYAEYRRSLVNPRNPPPRSPEIDYIRINNDSIVANTIIEDRLKDVTVGKPLDVATVEESIDKVYGLGFYQTVDYKVVEQGNQHGLEFDLTSRSWGPNYFQFGLSYISSADEDDLFGFAVSYLRTAINEHGSEFRGTLFAGDEPGLVVDLHQPLGPTGRFFVAPKLSFQSRHLSIFDGSRVDTQLRLRELTLEYAGGRELGYWGEVRGGIRRTVGDAKLRVGTVNPLGDNDFHRGEFFGRLAVDTFDNIAFPRTGILASAEWRGSRREPLSADADFDQLVIRAAHARTWGKYTLLSRLKYNSTISGVAPLHSVFRMGGFFDLSGLNREQLAGQNVARLSESVYRQIGNFNLFPAFAGFNLEVGNAWDSRDSISVESSIFAGSIWAGIDTPVGPVYMGYGVAEGGEKAVYIYLGRVF